MMDDDVVCEPEGIIRAVTFGDLARRPTIVGGHMFSLYNKSELHSFGEIVQPWRFWWMTPLDGYSRWDLSARNIRSARWLHKRVDVDFNGWFMCLIPRVVIDEIGLSLPLFIKWDDAEYGLRAQRRRLPDGDLPRRCRVARPVDRQERRARLAGLLPRAQPVRVGAAALAVPARRQADPRGPHPHDRPPGRDAVLHGGAAQPGARGRAGRPRQGCTRCCRPGSPR